MADFRKDFQVFKMEADGIVYGWGIVCSVEGEPYYDLQNDHIPDEVMREATTEFMKNCRVGKEMHSGDQKATLVHSFPLTKEVCELFDIECDKTGWMVGMQVHCPKMRKKFEDGTYTGFSIGGVCFEVEESE